MGICDSLISAGTGQAGVVQSKRCDILVLFMEVHICTTNVCLYSDAPQKRRQATPDRQPRYQTYPSISNDSGFDSLLCVNEVVWALQRGGQP